MAVNRVPVLKRCRSLGMDPVYLGIDKKSNRQLKRSNRKMSEYWTSAPREAESKIHLWRIREAFQKLLQEGFPHERHDRREPDGSA